MHPSPPARPATTEPQLQPAGRDLRHPTVYLSRIILQMQHTRLTMTGFPQESGAAHLRAGGRDVVEPALVPIAAHRDLAFPLPASARSEQCHTIDLPSSGYDPASLLYAGIARTERPAAPRSTTARRLLPFHRHHSPETRATHRSIAAKHKAFWSTIRYVIYTIHPAPRQSTAQSGCTL